MVRIYGKCFADGWIFGFLTLSDAMPFDTSAEVIISILRLSAALELSLRHTGPEFTSKQ